MIVILRPLTKDPWAGVFKYKGCNEDIAPIFTRSGRLYTGLTEEDADRLGLALSIDLRPGSEFWKTFYIRTSGKDIYLDLDDSMDELKYLFLKNHKRVAASLNDRKAGANFVLVNQETESKDANVFNRIKRRAYIELGKLSTTEMKQALRIFGYNAESMDAEVVEHRLTEIVEGNPEKFLEQFVDNKSRNTEYLIKTAVSKNVLRKNKTVYKFGTDVIGYTLEDTILYLDNPANQDIKIAITREIEAK